MTPDGLFDHLREMPPTGGLPLSLRHFLTPWRNDFAREAAAFIGVSGGGLECSGTACLIVILTTLRRLSTRRIVVVPAYTCPLVVFAIVHCGLRVRVCDLAKDSLEFDPLALRTACDEDTLAVIPTHLAGRVVRLDEVVAIAHGVDAYVIEDAAQSFAARVDGTSVGLQGDTGFFSFAAGKGLSLYEGGLWIAHDPQLRKALAQTSTEIIPRGLAMEALRCVQLAGYAACYKPLLLKLVYGLPLRRALRNDNAIEAAGDDFSADIPLHRISAWRRAVGCNALRELASFQEDLARQAAPRLLRLQALNGVKVFADEPGTQGVWPSFQLLMPTQAQRDTAMRRLWGAGLGVTRMFAHALPDYDYLQGLMEPADVPNARDFAARSLSISNSLWLDDARFAHVVQTLDDVLAGRD